MNRRTYATTTAAAALLVALSFGCAEQDLDFVTAPAPEISESTDESSFETSTTFIDVNIKRYWPLFGSRVKEWCVYEIVDISGSATGCPVSSTPTLICVACTDTGTCEDAVFFHFYRGGTEVCAAWAYKVSDCGKCSPGSSKRFIAIP